MEDMKEDPGDLQYGPQGPLPLEPGTCISTYGSGGTALPSCSHMVSNRAESCKRGSLVPKTYNVSYRTFSIKVQ
jgi:hypothetical protein